MTYLEHAKQSGIKELIENYKSEMLKQLAMLVAIPSLPTYTTEDGIPMGPEIIRALHCVLRYVSDRPKRSAPLPNAGKPWTEADEAALMQMFDAGCSTEEMQARFQRTNGAIVRRLERLGRLRPGETIK